MTSSAPGPEGEEARFPPKFALVKALEEGASEMEGEACASESPGVPGSCLSGEQTGTRLAPLHGGFQGLRDVQALEDVGAGRGCQLGFVAASHPRKGTSTVPKHETCTCSQPWQLPQPG